MILWNVACYVLSVVYSHCVSCVLVTHCVSPTLCTIHSCIYILYIVAFSRVQVIHHASQTFSITYHVPTLPHQHIGRPQREAETPWKPSLSPTCLTQTMRFRAVVIVPTQYVMSHVSPPVSQSNPARCGNSLGQPQQVNIQD